MRGDNSAAKRVQQHFVGAVSDQGIARLSIQIDRRANAVGHPQGSDGQAGKRGAGAVCVFVGREQFGLHAVTAERGFIDLWQGRRQQRSVIVCGLKTHFHKVERPRSRDQQHKEKNPYSRGFVQI